MALDAIDTDLVDQILPVRIHPSSAKVNTQTP